MTLASLGKPFKVLDALTARSHRLRGPVLVLIVLLGLLLSVLSAQKTHQSRARVAQFAFAEDAEQHLLGVTAALEQSLEVVRTLGDYLRSGESIDRDAFAEFTLPALRRHPTIHALAWVPRVDRAERETFESLVSHDLGGEFVISDRRGEAKTRAPQRELYFPITFIEPAESVAASLGVDLAPDEERVAALEQAAAEGRLVLSAPVPVTPGEGAKEEDDTRKAVIAYVPVYSGGEPPATVEERRESVLGFAAAEFLVSDVVGSFTGARRGDIRVYLFDTSLPAGQQLIYADGDGANDGGKAAATPESVLRSSPWRTSVRVPVGSREWLLVAVPTPGYVAARRSREPLIVLAVGLVLTTLVGLILWSLIRSSTLVESNAASEARANEALRQRMAEREAYDAALERANEELRRANADLERFVGAVSHDLKSPLVAAEMLISVMQQAVAKGDLVKTGETAGGIRKACGRMRRIIDDLLEHQRAGYAGMRSAPVDLVEVALEVIEDHRKEVTRRGAHVHLHDDLPTVRADRARITAALENLFSNAVKYGSRDGEPPEIEVGARVHEGEVRLFVRDHGKGVPAEHREAIFDLFRRLVRDDDGTGIGLAIVRRVAEAHGGHAWVEDADPAPGGSGGGAIFYLSLPRERLVKGAAEPRAESLVGA